MRDTHTRTVDTRTHAHKHTCTVHTCTHARIHARAHTIEKKNEKLEWQSVTIEKQTL